MPRVSSFTLAKLAFRAVGPFFKRLYWITRQLWHEITGSLFVVMAVGAIPSTLKQMRAQAYGRAGLAGTFVLMMGYFGITSFMRARRINREGAPS
jgi:hypothetical protein